MHAASARGLFPTRRVVFGIFCAYHLSLCLLGTPAPCQRATYRVRPSILASRGRGHNARARGGTARCELMEACWGLPSTTARAPITVCGRGRVSKTRAPSWLARVLAGGGTRKFPDFVFFAKIRPAGAYRKGGMRNKDLDRCTGAPPHGQRVPKMLEIFLIPYIFRPRIPELNRAHGQTNLVMFSRCKSRIPRN